MKLRILVAEADPEHLLFIHSALREIEEVGRGTGWLQVDVHHATDLRAAESVLASAAIDAVLLGLDLGPDAGAETFRRLQTAAPYIPLILMAAPNDRDLAAQLIREGAQDFLMKGEIDCEPLIHAISGAIERQRVLCALRASAKTDPLTGLLNRNGFESAAGRDRTLAERLELRYLVIVVKPSAPAPASQRRDLALVETADHLCSLVGPTGLSGRLSETHFALTFFDHPSETVEAAWSRVQSAASTWALRMGMAVFDAGNPASLEALLEQAEADMSRRSIGRAAAGN